MAIDGRRVQSSEKDILAGIARLQIAKYDFTGLGPDEI
jgi:hypothetical protein